MSAYTENLRHIAEPQAPSERWKAVSSTIQDFEALWFAEVLREFAHYGEHQYDEQSGIAVGYASYIDQKVREEGSSHVTLYAHTEQAAATLMDAVYDAWPDEGDRFDGFPYTIARSCEGASAEAFAHFVDDEEAPAEPPEPEVEEIDGEQQVVFDAEEARESYAIMSMEEAEAHYLQEQERRAERAFEEGRW